MKRGTILVINAGSSSLKFSLFRAPSDADLQLVLHGQVEGVGTRPRMTARDAAGTSLIDQAFDAAEIASLPDAIGRASPWLRQQCPGEPLLAIGHRVVHGGASYARPTLVDEAVLAALEKLIPLAPLHQPHNLAVIRAMRSAEPDLPQVACFDTAFHRGHPQLADLYALPWRYHEEGVRHYGFHGLSYEYIASVLPRFAPDLAAGRVIVAHLGSGASLCALRNGQSIDSSMGFSPLDGLAMGTRPGTLDPGVVLHLMRQHGMSAAELEHLLYHESGLLGLSGISSDMRILLESRAPRARLAVDYFVYQVAKHIGALAAVLGGLDGLVFTAGIGENSPAIRARIITACEWLGLAFDSSANDAGGPRVSAAHSAVSAWVIPTDEELMIARHTQALLRDTGWR